MFRPDLLDSTDSLQLCAGLQAGRESAVHAVFEIFEEEATDDLLLLDPSNAFNTRNRSVLQHNVQYICPPISTQHTLENAIQNL